MKAKGYAVLTKDKEIMVRTVSPNERGAKVNWLMGYRQILVTNTMNDAMIDILYESELRKEPVTIARVSISVMYEG